jgi:hypothetical protein
MIQNKGIAPTEAFTLLGASNTRDDDTAGTIGQFGTGAKHAINVLLRAGLSVHVYCGKTRLRFFTKTETMKDDLGEKTVERVYVKYGGISTRTEALGWVLDFGAIDWKDIGMSLREFVSNAVDRTLRGRPDDDTTAVIAEARANGDLTVLPVEDKALKAKAGYTRVFVQMNDDVTRYYGELPKRFLHFSDHPEEAQGDLLPKADRNLSDSKTAMVYRCGVFIMEMTGSGDESLYDYNFNQDQITIDDCRNSNPHSIRAACAAMLRRGSILQLTPVFQGLQGGKDCFERDLDSYSIMPSWESGKDDERLAWQGAWAASAGGAVLAEGDGVCGDAVAKLALRKGHQVAKMPTNWATVAARMGITTVSDVLTTDEKNGREALGATPAAIDALNQVWEWLEMADLTRGKDKPNVGCFRDIREAGLCKGYFKSDTSTVYLHEDLANGMATMDLLQVAIQQVAKYILGAYGMTDATQDLISELLVAMIHSPSLEYA